MKLLRLTSGEIETLNCSITIKEILFNIPPQKSPGLDGFTSESNLTFKEEIIFVLHGHLQKRENEGYFSPNFMMSAYCDQVLIGYIFLCSFGELCFSRNWPILI